MAYDREKYEKQDRSTNDVRESWSYVFIQIPVLFPMSQNTEFSMFLVYDFCTLTRSWNDLSGKGIQSER